MLTDTISPDDIRYNAAEEQFEARVTVHNAEGSWTYACSVYADLTMTSEQAAASLRNAAIARHTCEPGLFSTHHAVPPSPLRATVHPTWRERLLNALPPLRNQRAA